ncbi:MAG TPA: hypothetical protein ENJ51_01080 [Leucothrix mucor]|uniref:Uncharacterized protein n=1 Tax=Leucothrix mucor TaxID=45248 RepID=A0A7V2WU37_LEUMU|nr:hypothetical protein [Leucothrix mucor]
MLLGSAGIWLYFHFLVCSLVLSRQKISVQQGCAIIFQRRREGESAGGHQISTESLEKAGISSIQVE